MNHSLWSVLLFTCAAQCVFLLLAFLVKPLPNKRTATLLFALLIIILFTTVSNIWSSTYLYRVYPQVAGFARGMVLLLGPVLYLYVMSVMEPSFRFRTIQLLHFLPYIAGFIIIRLEQGPVSYPQTIKNIDQLMSGKVAIGPVSNLWFLAYFVHVLIYILAARGQTILSVKKPLSTFLIPVEQRIRWVKRLTLIFAFIALLFLGHTVNIMLTGVGGILTNYIYNLVLAVIVYLVAFQAIADNKLLSPGFDTRYRLPDITAEQNSALMATLLHLFEKEKVFTDPDLSLTSLAKKMKVHPHIVSRLVNGQLQQSFNDLVNYYRIEEFKKRAETPEYANYSIIGMAYDVGYNSKSSFNTAFKKQTGTTPSAYLRSFL